MVGADRQCIVASTSPLKEARVSLPAFLIVPGCPEVISLFTCGVSKDVFAFIVCPDPFFA